MGISGKTDASWSDLSDSSIRETWSAVIPATLVVFFLCLPAISHPRLNRVFGPALALLRTFLTLEEAEALEEKKEPSGDEEDEDTVKPTGLFWRAGFFVAVGLAQTLSWVAIGAYRFVITPGAIWSGVRAFLIGGIWLYTAIRPIASPTATPPLDLFTIYCAQVLTAALLFVGLFYEHAVYDVALPAAPILTSYAVNLVIAVALLVATITIPLAIPSRLVKKKDIGRTVAPEDYTTILQWATFSWVYPLVQLGRYNTLQENDVWNLSPTMQSRAVFVKFSSIKRDTLFRRLWAANSLDVTIDCSLTWVSIVLNYSNPFFLRKILQCIENPDATTTDRTRAYVFACLMFMCALTKTQSDVQHLWFQRRACTRVRSELMASIYDKALKRKDYSGVIDKDKQRAMADKKKEVSEGAQKGVPRKASQKNKAEENKAATGDNAKAGADVGKIVNLLALDANRLANTLSGFCNTFGAPLEIILGGTFLYQIMGISAFSGFFVLLAIWPVNSYLAKRNIRINKGASASRDKRMGVLSELIGAVKFIKFFAWEDRWVERALQARKIELDWMIKARINSIMFSALWISAPILISVTSFFTYIWLGNQLTLSVAFTAIALFNMIRTPMNTFPSQIVQFLQAGVALNRIAVYLDEEEVDAQVSSLKKRSEPSTSLGGAEFRLGLRGATLKWNEVPTEVEKDVNGKGKATEPMTSEDVTSEAQSETSTVSVADHIFELKDITVLFPDRVLSLVTGPTASGKTALLMALLGEMTLLEGEIILNKNTSQVDEFGLMHSLSYAAQSPWLQHRSIKDNILFGYPFDEQRYNAVLEACALNPDLEVLEDGDATEIGARGVSLSGGQKARVALARAVYARTKYVLLDDPLSAVDSHTSRVLFDQLLCGPLLANRTVILVTHHVSLVLPGAQYLVRMLDGRIDTQGFVQDLREQGVLDDIAHGSTIDAHKEEIASAEAEAVDEAAGPVEGDDIPVVAKTPRKLVKDEHREEGSVKWSIYKRYLKASSYWTWGFLLFLVLLNQSVGVTEKVWIMIWGSAYQTANEGVSTLTNAKSYRSIFTLEHQAPFTMLEHMVPNSFRSLQTISLGEIFTLPSPIDRPMFYVGVYALIGLISVIINLCSSATQYTAALKASRILFRDLLVTVVRATFRFHDTTPQGRILNRFGKDVEIIDLSLAGSLYSVNSTLASFLSSILTVAFVFPLFLLPASVFGYLYRELSLGYINTGRDLRRMESNTRSPIFQDFGELLEGIVTVRAFSAETRFLDALHKKLDLHIKMYFGFWMTNRWLLLNFDCLGCVAVFTTSLLAISNAKYGAGIAGLSITSALSFTFSVYWTCRNWTALELDLNAVERVAEYLELPQEPPAIIESNRPPAYWPSSSSDALVRVEDLVVKYAPELPSVLQNVSFTLKAGERVGLLGRTGSGKSTLAMSILRFTDPMSGRILIDGIDISTIGVHDLRSRLTFIPQDAALFSGTLRENLDPFGEHEDSACMSALHRVQMITDSQMAYSRSSRHGSTITSPEVSRPGSVHEERSDSALASTIDVDTTSTIGTDVETKTVSLDTQVSPGGNNFSQGQRQLIAMARALLRRSSVIVLDEATSSIDFATDAKIQATIREEFNDSLLLTVAHRLRTVIDYDRLIVMDKGKVVEIDTPYNLIRKEGGIFRTMCLKSGTFGELEEAAKKKAMLL